MDLLFISGAGFDRLAKGRAKVFNRVTGSVFIGAGALLSTIRLAA